MFIKIVIEGENMKITILSIFLILAGFGNAFYFQVDNQPNVSVNYRFYNAKSELIITSVRQQRSDGSWYEHQYYIHEGKVVSWKKVLGLVGRGVYDIKKDMMFFEGETNLFKPNYSQLTKSKNKILGFDVYKDVESSSIAYYSSDLNIVLKRVNEDGSYQIATSINKEIDEKDFVVPSLPINYDFYIKYLDSVTNKEAAEKLKSKYVPIDYVVSGNYFCDINKNEE